VLAAAVLRDMADVANLADMSWAAWILFGRGRIRVANIFVYR
jgi:hypothetical protein